MQFRQGCRDGVPIMLGYLTVSFTFGVSCVAKGFTWWLPVFCSLTNFTGTGQFAGMDLIAAYGSVLELIATMIVINARYSLMAISLSQRLDPKVSLWQRFVMAFGLTDENYAVAMRRQNNVTFVYFIGVILVSFSGWVVGTLLGALAGNILPQSLLSAFGIALYAMFIAIVIPPCRTSKAIAVVVLSAIGLSCIFYYVPYINKLSSGWAVIICGILAATIGAIFFPVKDNQDQSSQDDGNTKGSDNQSKDTSTKDASNNDNLDQNTLENNVKDNNVERVQVCNYLETDRQADNLQSRLDAHTKEGEDVNL